MIVVASAAMYAYDTLKGRNNPNRVTWVMWTLAPMIGFAAQLSQGVGLQSIFTFAIGFGPLLVLIASFVNRKAYWKLTTFDLLCGSISLVALVLWVATGEGLVALVLASSPTSLPPSLPLKSPISTPNPRVATHFCWEPLPPCSPC
jgi:hypothetical protein